jgi:Methylase of polypeptide chain release factors
LLGGGPDGLDTVKAVLADGWDHLAPGGVMLVEIGYKQAQKAREFLKGMLKRRSEDEVSSCRISVIKDYAGLDRVLCVEKKV